MSVLPEFQENIFTSPGYGLDKIHSNRTFNAFSDLKPHKTPANDLESENRDVLTLYSYQSGNRKRFERFEIAIQNNLNDFASILFFFPSLPYIQQ